jgi:hypothetical protein
MNRYTPCPSASPRDVLSANMLHPVMRSERKAPRSGLWTTMGAFVGVMVLLAVLA